jgi:hypothetical protein
MLLQTALAAETHLAEGLTLKLRCTVMMMMMMIIIIIIYSINNPPPLFNGKKFLGNRSNVE